ncbi:MAG: TetR family transcriptional regulator [Actinobacteria bacterium]|nr:TetR family transcriptional regulator [Actinomycetota bacterium]
MTVGTEIRPNLLPSRDDLQGARLRLFEAAIVQFGARGYHAVSVRDLMSELGQQPGALYFHVASKEHLLFELVKIGLDVHRDRLKAALLDAGREPHAQVRAVVEEHVCAHLDYPALARVTIREITSLTGENLATALAMRTENARILLDVIKRGVEIQAFGTTEPDLAVHAIGAMGMRAVEWWTPDSPHSKDHVARTYGDFALKVLV